MVLIITNTQDPHADHAIRLLRQREVSVFRLNTEDFLGSYRTCITVGLEKGWEGSCWDELGREVDLANCRVGWIRRPDFSFVHMENMDGDVSKYILSEYKAFINNLYALPNIHFVNDHFEAERAKNKIQQLILATQLGVKVPQTIITNDPEKALKFVESCEAAEILTKPIYTSNFFSRGVPQGIPSTKISKEEFKSSSHLISLVPTKIQEYVEKKFEVRIVVIGDKVFSVKLDSQANDSTKVDWRTGTALCPHEVVEIPPEAQTFCIAFLRRQRLVYGAFDFIVTPGDEYVFLENNPAGQYLWLEEATGIPITEALCDLFESLQTNKRESN